MNAATFTDAAPASAAGVYSTPTALDVACQPCTDYWLRRGPVILSLLGSDSIDVLAHFAQGVHQRHVDGLSLWVCNRCGATPDPEPTGPDQPVEFLEPDLCSPCVVAEIKRRVRDRVIYSVPEAGESS